MHKPRLVADEKVRPGGRLAYGQHAQHWVVEFVDSERHRSLSAQTQYFSYLEMVGIESICTSQGVVAPEKRGIEEVGQQGEQRDLLAELDELNRSRKGVVTLSEIGTIWTINQQAKPLKILASKLAVVGEFH